MRSDLSFILLIRISTARKTDRRRRETASGKLSRYWPKKTSVYADSRLPFREVQYNDLNTTLFETNIVTPQHIETAGQNLYGPAPLAAFLCGHLISQL